LHEQLTELNQQWAQIQVEHPVFNSEINIQKHEYLIQLHLSLVEKYLRNNPPKNLTEKQIKNRIQGLDILKDYWQKGVFPQNLYHSQTIPYFIDDFNTACAVGHILRESGGAELAHRIAKEMNNAYLKDMAFDDLPLWAEKMGFSLFELKWIQPSYSPAIDYHLNSIDQMQPDCNQNNGHIYLDYYFYESEPNEYELAETIGRWYDIDHNLLASGDSIDDLAAGMYYFEKYFHLDLDVGSGTTGQKVFPVSDIGGPTIKNTTITPESCTMRMLTDFNPYSFDIINFIVQNNFSDEYQNINYADGSIQIELAEELPSENIFWYDYDGNQIGTGYEIYNLDANKRLSGFDDYRNISIYYAEITGLDNCKTFEKFEVPGDGHYEIEVAITPPSSPTANDGGISFLPTNVEYWPAEFQYAWSLNLAFPLTVYYNDIESTFDQYWHGPSIEGLGIGTHTFEIETSLGCTQTFNIQLTSQTCENSEPCTDKLICEQVNNSDCGQNNGRIQITVDEVFPAKVDYYDINNQVIGAGCSLENLSAGVYHYQVTIDSMGTDQTYINKIVISDENGPEISNIDVQQNCRWRIFAYDIDGDPTETYNDNQTPFGYITGSISISLEEELPDENIVWYDPFGHKIGTGYSMDNVYNNNYYNSNIYGSQFKAEDYVVHITDNNGCQTLQKIPLNDPIYTEVWIGFQTNSDEELYDGSLTILENNPISGEALEPVIFELTDLEGTTYTDLNNLGSGIYQFTFINSEGCYSNSETYAFGGCNDMYTPMRIQCQSDSTFFFSIRVINTTEQFTAQFTQPIDTIFEFSGNSHSFSTSHNPIEKGIQGVISNSDGTCAFTINERFVAICSDSIINPIDTVDTGFNTTLTESNQFVLYPNPAQSRSIIKFYSTTEQPIHYRIINISGKTIQHEIIQSQQGLNEHGLDLNNLNSGIYLIELFDGQNYQTQKLVVE